MRIYTGNHLEKLVESLATNLAQEKVLDPAELFSRPQDVVVIQSQGMAKWLKQNIAQHAKISAHIDFPFIRGFIVKVLERAGIYEKNKIWDREVLCWRIFHLLPKYEEQFELIGRYISDKPIRRQQLSQRLAALMDEYLTYRPDWIEFWSKNKVPKIKKMMGAPVEVEHEPWQRALWQDLISEDSHTFQRALSDFIDNVGSWTHKDLALPKRLAIFGITNMPPAFVNFFNALSQICEIDLYHLNPCEAYWADQDSLQFNADLFERPSCLY